MRRLADSGYNDRLFAGGIRARLHYSRFHWLAQSLSRLKCVPKRVLELGCFDGKTIEFLPVKPDRYVGFDANWEGGLEIAREKWKGQRNYEFVYCSAPNEIRLNERFDVSICMETLEHVPPGLVEPYLATLVQLSEKYVLITVPNEKGVVFATKYLVKRLARGDYSRYTISEYISQTLGRMQNVQRDEHKGFDYEAVVTALSKHAAILEVSPYPFRALPKAFGFGIGIIGKPHGNCSIRPGSWRAPRGS